LLLGKRLWRRLRKHHDIAHDIAYDPELIPPPALMRQEGIDVLEEWFRWGEEWSMLLRVYGEITRISSVLEIGCGLGRTAFPLRFILSSQGSYEGFEIVQNKVAFLKRTFERKYPNFRFTWADIHNTYYNTSGQIKSTNYRFPYPDASFEIVYAASVFTHMLPESVAHYIRESARVLKPGGRCVFSFFLVDNYRPGQPRPLSFADPLFNFDHPYRDYGDDFRIGVPENPEHVTAYRMRFINRFAAEAHLSLVHAPVAGFWSGSSPPRAGVQDLVVLAKGSTG
jgi:SAM-dependent methyltransferase